MDKNVASNKRLNELLIKHKPNQVVLKPGPNFKNLISPVVIDKPSPFVTNGIEQQIRNFVEELPFPTALQIENVVGDTINVTFINLPNTA